MTTPGITTIDLAVAAIRAGRPVIVADDEDRENEGDVILSAELATPEWVAWTVRWSSGLLCAPMSNQIADQILDRVAGDAHRARLLAVAGGDETARDFTARSVRLVGGKKAGGHVALDLAELIEIDRALAAAVARKLRGAAERPQHGEHRRERHQCE